MVFGSSRRSSVKPLVFLVVCLLLAGFAWINLPNSWDGNRIHYSKETTFISEPLMPDGRVDYQSYQNQVDSKRSGTTDNAAVLLFPLFQFDSDETRLETARLLGMEQVPSTTLQLGLDPIEIEKDKRSISFARNRSPDYRKKNREFDELVEETTRRLKWPWKTSEFPEWNEYIQESHAVLELFSQAFREADHFYFPMVEGTRAYTNYRLYPRFFSFIEGQCASDIFQLLHYRAMNRIGDGKIEQAIDDLKTIRLAVTKLAFTNKSACYIRVIYWLEKLMFLELQLFASDKISSSHLNDYRSFMLANQFPNRLADLVCHDLRFNVLSTIQDARTFGLKSLPSPIWSNSLLPEIWEYANHNETMRAYNARLDEVCEILMMSDLALAKKKLLDTQQQVQAEDANSKELTLKTKLLGRNYRAQIVARHFFQRSLGSVIEDFFWTHYYREFEKHLVTYSALRQHQLDQGELPLSLSELVPQYLSQQQLEYVSKYSTSSPTSVEYQTSKNGFRLISLGVNNQDDGQIVKWFLKDDVVLGFENGGATTSVGL